MPVVALSQRLGRLTNVLFSKRNINLHKFSYYQEWELVATIIEVLLFIHHFVMCLELDKLLPASSAGDEVDDGGVSASHRGHEHILLVCDCAVEVRTLNNKRTFTPWNLKSTFCRRT